MAQLTEAQKLFHFVERAKKNTRKAFLSDGRRVVVLRLNPQQFRATSVPNAMDVQTLDGFGRMDFGVKPTTYTLDGFTGLDGYDGPGGLYAMEYFRPMIGKPNKMVMFGFPARFEGVRYCYIDSFEDRIEQQRHLYAAFTLQLVEYGPHVNAPAVRVPSSFSPLVS